MVNKIRIAFIMFGGLSAGGTEKWLQMMAVNLPKEKFEVDYYYCDPAPLLGSKVKMADTNPDRLKYMMDHKINLIKFKVGFKDITKRTHNWLKTNFWEIFDSTKYDFVQTAKGGPAEYPYYLINLPVVECLTLLDGVDKSPNIAYSILISEWQRAMWFRMGGNIKKSTVIPIPAEPSHTNENMREELDIPDDAIVAGFHQRVDNYIFSPIPLQAFSKIQKNDRHFIIMGGGDKYKQQQQKLQIKNVHFIEHSGNPIKISKFLNTLDIFAHGREGGETFGTVFAEAMMHGKACLSHWCDFGANAQAETMGPAGLFALDLNDYRVKLKKLFVNREFRDKLSAKAFPHAMSYYSLKNCVERLSYIYYKLLGISDKFSPSQRMTYGYSNLGFLYAGKIKDVYNIAYGYSNLGFLYAGKIGGAYIPVRFQNFGIHTMNYILPYVKTFIDITPNTGLFSYIAANKCPENSVIHIFDSHPDTYKILTKTIYLNNWEDKIKLHKISLSNQKGNSDFYDSQSCLNSINAFNNTSRSPRNPVKVDTLDNQIRELEIDKVDLIKFESENLEKNILEGAKQTIEQDHPIIFVNNGYNYEKKEYKNVNHILAFEWLKLHGYTLWTTSKRNRLIKINRLKKQNYPIIFLALHNEMHHEWISEIVKWAKLYKGPKIEHEYNKIAEKIQRNILHPNFIVKKLQNKFK